MSRIRTIKPEFWTSEQIVSCSPNARLLFIGLWNFCDDHGVHPASYVRLKAEVFPVDNFSIEETKRWIGELTNNDLVREYAANDKSYWIVTGWERHQRIDRPTYRHPTPLSELKKIEDPSSNIHRTLDDNSKITRRLVADPSTTEWKGMEGKGMEKDIGEVETSPVHVPSDNQPVSNDIQSIFQHWQTVMNHPRAKFDKKRQYKIEQALKLDYGAAELKQAIDGCAKTPYNMGKNDQGQRYDDLELIFRDASHIERFISNAINPPAHSAKTNGSDLTTNLMLGVI